MPGSCSFCVAGRSGSLRTSRLDWRPRTQGIPRRPRYPRRSRRTRLPGCHGVVFETCRFIVFLASKNRCPSTIVSLIFSSSHANNRGLAQLRNKRRTHASIFCRVQKVPKENADHRGLQDRQDTDIPLRTATRTTT